MRRIDWNRALPRTALVMGRASILPAGGQNARATQISVKNESVPVLDPVLRRPNSIAAHTAPPLRSGFGNPARRFAFSLVEMMVVVAVLIVALAVVTNVFSISARTAATSQAISEVEASVQRFLADLEADLKGIDTTQSVLVLDGRKQVAAKTEELRQAQRRWRLLVGDPTRVPGLNVFNPETDTTPESAFPTNSPRDQFSDPRCDVMMFFTNNARPSRQPSNVALPTGGGPAGSDLFGFQRSLQRGAKAALVQAVYGHLSFATPTRTPNGLSYTWPNSAGIRHIETADAGEDPSRTISELPLTKWTVGARRTLIEDVSVGVSRSAGLSQPGVYPRFKDVWTFSVADPTGGQYAQTWDRITRAWAPPGTNFAGDSAALRYRDWLTFFRPRIPTSLFFASQPFGLALANPYAGEGWTANLNGASRDLVMNLMYHPDQRSQRHHHIATLSEVAAADLTSNLAMGALPGCAWFQVEFLMPEDPRNSLDSPIASQRDDMPRWCEIAPGSTYVFVPDTVENRQLIAAQVDAVGKPLSPTLGGWDRLNRFGMVIPPTTNEGNWTPQFDTLNNATNRNLRLWPYAIRITVRVFDTGGKLQEPLTRTLIHRFDM